MLQGDKYQAEEWSGNTSSSGVNHTPEQQSTNSAPVDLEKLFANLPGNENLSQKSSSMSTVAEGATKSTVHETAFTQEGEALHNVVVTEQPGKKEVSLRFKVILGIVTLAIIFIAVVALKLKGSPSKGEGTEVTPTEALPEWLVEPPVVSAFEYTAEEIALLRLNGYTGDEIEAYEAARINAAELIEDAQAARQVQYEEEIEPYMDSASEEFKELRDSTWLGLDALEVDEETSKYTRYVEKHNVDYVKLESRGSQLILKLEMQSGRELFMFVSPEQYVRLKDSGNIVVMIEYIRMGNGEIVVTKIEEVLL